MGFSSENMVICPNIGTTEFCTKCPHKIPHEFNIGCSWARSVCGICEDDFITKVKEVISNDSTGRKRTN